jgi:hypothetical protein
MKNNFTTSHYFLTKEKKLEIQEQNQIYRAKIPLRFYLNPWALLKNLVLTIIKSKKRLRAYSVYDQKDKKTKIIYLTHNEIQQVWNHPVAERAISKTPSIIKKGMSKPKTRK